MIQRADPRLRAASLVMVAFLLCAGIDAYFLFHARVHHGVFWTNGAYVLLALILMAVASFTWVVRIFMDRRRRDRRFTRWGASL